MKRLLLIIALFALLVATTLIAADNPIRVTEETITKGGKCKRISVNGGIAGPWTVKVKSKGKRTEAEMLQKLKDDSWAAGADVLVLETQTPDLLVGRPWDCKEQRVRITNDYDKVEGCEFLGEVKRSRSIFYSGNQSRKESGSTSDTTNELRRDARRMYANTLLVISADEVSGEGEAYFCQEATNDKPSYEELEAMLKAAEAKGDQ